MSTHVVNEKQFSELKGYAALRPWVVTLVAALFFMYQFAQVNMFNALGPAMLDSFHIDALQLGNLSAMSIYANVLLLPVAGLILDRFSAFQYWARYVSKPSGIAPHSVFNISLM